MLQGSDARDCYAIALGSNRACSGYTRPEVLLRAAILALESGPWEWLCTSRIYASSPLGPSSRRYANAVGLLVSSAGVHASSGASPRAVLAYLQEVEERFARKRYRHWGARTLDLDMILWSGGSWCDNRVTLPHPDFRARNFVLEPLCEVAPEWHDSLTGFTVRQLAARNKIFKPVDPCL